jgi:hypothetical protein
VGDSWWRGYGLGVFGDQVPANHPVFRLRSPSSMAELILTDNGRPHDRLCQVGGAAVNLDGTADLLRRRLRDGIIRAGDVVFLEDAGDHSGNPDEYEARLLELRAAITERHHVTCVMMTTPDYVTDPALQWDYPLVGGRTMNDAIRAAARADLDQVGQTLLLDHNATMDWWRIYAYGQHGLPMMLPDGIHTSLWGQLLWVGDMLRVAGWRGLTNLSTITSIFSANPGYTYYGSQYANPSVVQQYVTYCVAR